MAYFPRRPTGTTAKALFDEWVFDTLMQFLGISGDGKTVTIRKTPKGLVFSATAQSGGASGARQGPFIIQSVQGDYVTAFKYSAVTQEAVDSNPVYIAKQDKHQQSLTDETIFGVVHNYTYVPGTTPPTGLAAADINNVFRIDSVNGDVQRIVPPWCFGEQGDIIWADPTPGLNRQAADGSQIKLLIAGRSCLWGLVTQ